MFSGEHFHQRLRAARALRRLRQVQVAGAAGIKQCHVSSLEIGRTNPSPRTIRDLARVLGVSERWLRDGEGPMEPTAAATQEDDAPGASELPDDEDQGGLTLWQHLEELDGIMAAIGLQELKLESTACPGTVLVVSRRRED